MSLTYDEMKEKLEKLEEQENKLKARKRKMKAQMSAKKRKERTKRLIEKGAIIEKLQGEQAEKIPPEDTLNWIKNNVNSSKNNSLEEENEILREKLEFFQNYAKRWKINGENVTDIISRAYKNNKYYNQ